MKDTFAVTLIGLVAGIGAATMSSQAQSNSAASGRLPTLLQRTGLTVESVAEEIARKHNEGASSMLDEMTVSTSAQAIGKNVVFRYVLRVQKGLSETKLREFELELTKEIVPRACAVNADNEGFRQGLYYTFIYHNTYSEKLAEFVVSKPICDGLNSRSTDVRVDAAWVKFGENERFVAYYERPAPSDTVSVVWVMYDYKTEQESAESGRKYFSQKAQQEVDCRGARSRTIFFTWHAGHMGDGVVVYTGRASLPWEPNSPGSIARALAAVVCAKN